MARAVTANLEATLAGEDYEIARESLKYERLQYFAMRGMKPDTPRKLYPVGVRVFGLDLSFLPLFCFSNPKA